MRFSVQDAADGPNTYTYVVQATTNVEDVVVWTDPSKTFTTVCGAASAGILAPDIPETLTYEINGEVPTLGFAEFTT